MASKWLSITFFYKSIPIYPGKSRTIPESQLGRTMFLLTEQALRSNVADNLVGITTTSGRYKSCRFSFVS